MWGMGGWLARQLFRSPGLYVMMQLVRTGDYKILGAGLAIRFLSYFSSLGLVMVVNLGGLSSSSDPEFGCTVASSFQEGCVYV